MSRINFYTRLLLHSYRSRRSTCINVIVISWKICICSSIVSFSLVSITYSRFFSSLSKWSVRLCYFITEISLYKRIKQKKKKVESYKRGIRHYMMNIFHLRITTWISILVTNKILDLQKVMKDKKKIVNKKETSYLHSDVFNVWFISYAIARITLTNRNCSLKNTLFACTRALFV